MAKNNKNQNKNNQPETSTEQVIGSEQPNEETSNDAPESDTEQPTENEGNDSGSEANPSETEDSEQKGTHILRLKRKHPRNVMLLLGHAVRPMPARFTLTKKEAKELEQPWAQSWIEVLEKMPK